jgi:hypothetical protein
MSRSGAVRIAPREVDATSTSMVVVLTYWLSYEYVRDPRRALEPAGAQQALLRGAHHVLHLLVPYLEPAQRTHLLQLAGAYGAAAAPGPEAGSQGDNDGQVDGLPAAGRVPVRGRQPDA